MVDGKKQDRRCDGGSSFVGTEGKKEALFLLLFT